MRLLAKESLKPNLEVEKARRLALAVIDAEKQINTLRNSFEEEKVRLSTSLSSLQRDIEGRSSMLKGEIENLEARRMAAVRPIMDEMKEAARRSEEATKAQDRATNAFKELETKETALDVRMKDCDARQQKVSEMESMLSEMFLLAKRKKEETDESYAEAQGTIQRITDEILVREAQVVSDESRVKAEETVLKAEFERLSREKESTLKEIDRLASERRKLKQNKDYMDKTYGQRAI